MRIAVTGGTGFIGHYLVRQFLDEGHQVRCWYRSSSRRDALHDTSGRLEWCEGSLGDRTATERLVLGCDAVVHAALDRPGRSFRGGEGNVSQFVTRNVVGTIDLIEAARQSNVGRFVFLSTCAVYEKILSDRPLDETHPMWPTSHYGAHKAALEEFVYSYGLGQGYPICALRPTGVYGVAQPPEESKWYPLVADVVRGKTVLCKGGGKEVHAADVAKACSRLLAADGIAGQAYNCYDLYVSEFQVAHLAKRLSGSDSKIDGQPTSPKNQIVTEKLRHLGMTFGGEPQLEQTIATLVHHAQRIHAAEK